MTRTFTSRPSSLREIREFIRGEASAASFGSAVNDIVLAASEACANAIRHSWSKQISVTWRALRDRAEVRVEDQGVYGTRVPMRETEEVGGFGIPLMFALMDEVIITRGTPEEPGTVVRLVVHKDSAGREPAGRS